MRFHSQNLNDKKAGTLGSMWRHGRCWLNWGKETEDLGRAILRAV